MNKCCNCDASICRCGAFIHPAVIFNPPGRQTLSYRVGDFPAFRRALLQSRPGETQLSSTVSGITTPIWQPSGHGDLALQMMEWWAYLADILTFYNQRIANQAYLGTADLPESVTRLVRLLGYRPRPGIGAKGTLAALANTPMPFTLPRGFAIQSKPGPGQQPQVFELNADTTVGIAPTGPVSPEQMLGAATTPARALAPSPNALIVIDKSTSPVTSVLTVAGKSTGVKQGDRVLLVAAATATGLAPATNVFGFASVTSVAPSNDPALGAITSVTVAWTATPNPNTTAGPWQLYRGGQSTQVWQYPATDKLGLVVGNDNAIHLQSVVRGIQTGDPTVFQFPDSAINPTYRLLIVQSTSEAIWFANPASPDDPCKALTSPTAPPPIPIPHTKVTTSTSLPTNVSTTNDTTAARATEYLWHSWTPVAALIAAPPAIKTVGGTAGAGARVILDVPNTITALQAAHAGAQTIPVLVVDSVGRGATGAAVPPGVNPPTPATVTLDDPVPLLIPPLQTYFNLLTVTRGKTVPNEVLGSGNATLAGQDFTLKNAPVTYLQDAASVSGVDYSSTVHVWVNGLEWAEVQSFYGQSPDAQVFVTREDVSGKTHVAFGDGVCGSRLPTGVNNVTATYRFGSGAASPSEGKLTVVLKPQPGLRSIVNPVAVGGGSDPDPSGKIRQFAPQSVLTFGRAVSADDFRVIAAQAPGVTRAAAAFGFDPIEQRPRVTVWVGDDQNALISATSAIAAAADPNRLPAVSAATRQQITLSLSIVVAAKYQADVVQAAVYAALLDPDAGLIGVNRVGIGQVFFDSQLYAACLAVPGVSAVHNLQWSNQGGAAPAPPSACDQSRHDPGAGNYYFLADDGAALSVSVEAA